MNTVGRFFVEMRQQRDEAAEIVDEDEAREKEQPSGWTRNPPPTQSRNADHGGKIVRRRLDQRDGAAKGHHAEGAVGQRAIIEAPPKLKAEPPDGTPAGNAPPQ